MMMGFQREEASLEFVTRVLNPFSHTLEKQSSFSLSILRKRDP